MEIMRMQLNYPISISSKTSSKRRLFTAALMVGVLSFSAIPARAMDSTDANLKETFENIEKQTGKNFPRAIAITGSLVALGYSVFKRDIQYIGYALLGCLGYSGVAKWIDKTYAATLDEPEAREFLLSDEELARKEFVSSPQPPSSPSSVESKRRNVSWL